MGAPPGSIVKSFCNLAWSGFVFKLFKLLLSDGLNSCICPPLGVVAVTYESSNDVGGIWLLPSFLLLGNLLLLSYILGSFGLYLYDFKYSCYKHNCQKTFREQTLTCGIESIDDNDASSDITRLLERLCSISANYDRNLGAQALLRRAYSITSNGPVSFDCLMNSLPPVRLAKYFTLQQQIPNSI